MTEEILKTHGLFTGKLRLNRWKEVRRMHTDQCERLTELMREHGNAIFRMGYMHLHDVQLAEDAAQETFLKA